MNETIIQIPTGYVPDYFLYIVSSVLILSFILLTTAYKSKKTNWGNFWQVILFSTLIIGISIAFLIVMPEILVDMITKLINFFGF